MDFMNTIETRWVCSGLRTEYPSTLGDSNPRRAQMTTMSIKNREAFTLVELLVVIGVIALIVALLLPAVNAAREAGRQSICRNKIRQLGTAMILFHDSHRQFPSGGWGDGWVGDPDLIRSKQPGSWCYSVLPYLEEEPLAELGKGESGAEKEQLLAEANAKPVGAFYCPSRRGATTYPHKRGFFANATSVYSVCKTDYAANGGDVGLGGGWGPKDYEDSKTFEWDDFREANGVCHQRSRVHIRHVQDGTSRTFLLGEKSVTSDNYVTGNDNGDDQSAFTGYDADTIRWTPPELTPQRDSIVMRNHSFGSPHAGSCNFALCDGSVQSIEYSVDPEVYRAYGNRRDVRNQKERSD